MRQAVVFEIDQSAAAEVIDEGNAMLLRQLAEGGFGDDSGKTFDDIIGCMDLHDHAGAGLKGRLEILKVGAVGGADFDQLATRSGHDVRHTKGTTDLDEFAARDSDAFAESRAY